MIGEETRGTREKERSLLDGVDVYLISSMAPVKDRKGAGA